MGLLNWQNQFSVLEKDSDVAQPVGGPASALRSPVSVGIHFELNSLNRFLKWTWKDLRCTCSDYAYDTVHSTTTLNL
ncbi:hypothetical protein NECAME_03844 [Necator americanus]|uniref:Uncharacterized protein n=1 Tax=Necator americanus TaxID=51031 RepID=W2T1J2_NECAM|nr:hypothetical protein NECAME_03844 [Necator americanus]ETN75121.1 hypothetical protein NECAME_03844 [Necator americanus]